VYAEDTAAWQAAAQAIGLKVVLKPVSIQGYVNFLYSPRPGRASTASRW
jgi:hypothetical protein